MSEYLNFDTLGLVLMPELQHSAHNYVQTDNFISFKSFKTT